MEWETLIEVDLTKRYWLFAYDTHYPYGGLDDLKKTFDTEEEAKEYYAEKLRVNEGHIFDSIEKKCLKLPEKD